MTTIAILAFKGQGTDDTDGTDDARLAVMVLRKAVQIGSLPAWPRRTRGGLDSRASDPHRVFAIIITA